MPLFDNALQKYRRKVYSQNDEDGIIEYIFSQLPPLTRFLSSLASVPPAVAPTSKAVSNAIPDCSSNEAGAG